MKKWICGVLALGLCVFLALPAAAAEKTGSIRVTLQNGETVVPNGSVMLYRVGSLVEECFWLRDAFGGGMVHQEDAMSAALAKWLAEMVREDGIELELDDQGSAEFSDLEQGLYLLVQSELSTGYHRMEPMTVMLPCQQQWNVQAFPMMQEIFWEVPATGQSPLPFFGLVGMVLSGLGLLGCLVWAKRQPLPVHNRTTRKP